MGSTGSSIWRGNRACAASATSSRSTCVRTSSRPSASSRRRSATACGSCSPRRRRSTARRTASRRPRTPRRTRSRRTVSRSSPASSCSTPTCARSVSTPSCSATSTRSGRASGPTWRSRESRSPWLSGATFELYGDGAQSRSWTYVADIVAATIRAMEAGTGTYNVGGSLEASMAEAIALFEQLAGRPLDGSPERGRGGRPAADGRGHDADPEGARLGPCRGARRGFVPPMGVGFGYSRRAMTATSPDLDAEREVDLARWRRAVVRLWWLPVAGVVVGAIFGGLYSLSGGTDYKASALISLGQPVSPGGVARQRLLLEPARDRADHRAPPPPSPMRRGRRGCRAARCAETCRSPRSEPPPATGQRARRR